MEESPGEITGYQSGETQPLIPKEKGVAEPQFTDPPAPPSPPPSSPPQQQQPQQEQRQNGSSQRSNKELIFSPKGIFRVFQIALAIAIISLIRGSGGSLWVVMSSIDEVYLAIGTLVGFLIITPAMYITYISSRGSAAAAPLEMIVSLVGFVLFVVNGILIINTWRDVESASGGQLNFNNVQSLVTGVTGMTIAGATAQINKAMLAAGGLSLVNGLLYAVELVYTYKQHRKVCGYQNV